MSSCPLCTQKNEIILYATPELRIIQAQDEPDYPALCRVILNQHCAEMSDLPPALQQQIMHWVIQTEKAMRDILKPAKINLASLGNYVPHLHWHIIPRFEDDAHFPAPIWGTRQREGIRHGTDNGFTEAMHKALVQTASADSSR